MKPCGIRLEITHIRAEQKYILSHFQTSVKNKLWLIALCHLWTLKIQIQNMIIDKYKYKHIMSSGLLPSITFELCRGLEDGARRWNEGCQGTDWENKVRVWENNKCSKMHKCGKGSALHLEGKQFSKACNAQVHTWMLTTRPQHRV